MSKVKDGGIVTAYGAAVRGGYVGTYQQFCAALGQLAEVLEEFEGFSVEVTTLNPGAPATADYNDGVLTLGIPRGETGNGIQSAVLNSDYTLTLTWTNGQHTTVGPIRGAVGATPNLTIGNVQTLQPSQPATATITGTPEDPVLNFGIPKGDPGTNGISPAVTITEITDGHRVTITDGDHPQGQSFDVMDGQDGASDAGDVTYDETATYQSGTVGAELSSQKNAIGELVLAQDTQPSSADNRIWVDPDDNEIEIPTMDDFDMLSNALDDNGIGNAFDGVLHNGYWNGSGVIVDYQNLDVCNENKIPCVEGDSVVIVANTMVTDLTYYISYLDDTQRIARDSGTGTAYTGTAPTGAKYVCFTFEKSGIDKDTFGTVGVYINNAINKLKKQLAETDETISFVGIERPVFTVLSGVINDRGAVIGSLPNAHTSDISLNKGDTVIVNCYYYAGFAIISEHSGDYYIPLVSATSNSRVTTKYTATRDMAVSVSIDNSITYDIMVLRNDGWNKETSSISASLNNIVDLTQYTWDIGTLNSYGSEEASTKRIRSDFIPVNSGTIISAIGAASCIDVFTYNSIGNLVAETGWITDNYYEVPDNIVKVRIVIRVSQGDETIPAADIGIIRDKCTITLKVQNVVYFDELKNVPAYYQTMMESKAEQIRTNLATIGNDGDSFVFFTDFHIDSNTLHTPALIKYIQDSCGIENVVFGGDAINNESSKAEVYAKLEQFNHLFSEYGIKFNTVVGNHEFNNPSENEEYASIQLTASEVYPFLVKNEEMNPFADSNPADLAFYIDNKVQKIRYIYIPCNYAGDITTTASSFGVSAIQTAPSGYSMVVFTHYALQTNLTMRPSFTTIAAALDAIKGTDKTPVCVITGHTHRDLVGATNGGIPIICTTCDSNEQVADPSTRAEGTTNEQAFDVFQINKTTRTITIVRIGAGSDRTFQY